MTDPPSGATGLLAGAISYTLGVCALIGPGEMALSTPCADWHLARLLGHLSDSMADLETAIRTGRLDLEGQPDHAAGDPVETLRDRAAELLCAAFGYGGPERFVTVGGLPVPAAWWPAPGRWRSRCTAGTCRRPAPGPAAARPIPAALATRMLRLVLQGQLVSAPREGPGPGTPGSSGRASSQVAEGYVPVVLGPLLVAGREGLFAVPVDVPAQASPGDRLVAYLGRHPV